MFDSTKRFAARLTDAVDLLIDFATLGEYGLEPVEVPRRCQARRRARAPRQPRRGAARPHALRI